MQSEYAIQKEPGQWGADRSEYDRLARQRAYHAVMADLWRYRQEIDMAITLLEAHNSKFVQIDLTNAPIVRQMLEHGSLSKAQQAALAELYEELSGAEPAARDGG